MAYEITLAQYNSPYGKIPIPGTFAVNVPVNVAYSGTVNVGTGLKYQRGAIVTNRSVTGDFGEFSYALKDSCCTQTRVISGYVPNDYKWFGHSTWADWDGGNPPYLEFRPTRPFSASFGFMCTIEIEYEEGVNRTDRAAYALTDVWGQGLGEVAIFADFGGGDLRRLMWTGAFGGDAYGVPQQKYAFAQYDQQAKDLRGPADYSYSDGWAVPNDPTMSIVSHYRDIFNERVWTGKSWANVQAVRVIFQNAWDDMAVRIKKCRFYEPVVLAPTSQTLSMNTTTVEAEYSVVIDGITSTAYPTGFTFEGTQYRKSGVIYVEGWYNTPGGPYPSVGATGYGSRVPNLERMDTIEFTGLDPAERGENVVVWDGYGNRQRVVGSWGATTKLQYVSNAEDEVTYDRDNNIAHLDVTISEGLVPPGKDPVKLRWLSVWMSSKAGASPSELTVPENIVVAEDYTANPIALPHTLIKDLHWDSTGGGTIRIRALGERWYSDGQNLNAADGSAVNDLYYFEFDKTYYADEGPPKIKAIDGKGLGASIQLAAWAWCINGLTGIRFWEKLPDDTLQLVSDLPIDRVDGKYPQSCNKWIVIPSEPGTERTFVATCTSFAGLDSNTDSEITLRSDGSDIMSETRDFYVIPVFEAFILDDSSVLLRWTSWDDFVTPSTVFRHKIHHFKLYRKNVKDDTDYTCINENIPGTALRYHDVTISEPGIYDYRLVGVNVFDDETAVSALASIGSGPTVSYIPFVEEVLGALPKWLAASPRNYTLDALVKG